ncbi:unnamed protein product [Prorocentrum cordatum]|uniref:Uncharacterized protein n=1 Tax=Prorocentrum cordatum TaxID=2364126 RepID=A0ABN9QUW8_9DINO|nr:unnamed protein product [Polarella glacialis]
MGYYLKTKMPKAHSEYSKPGMPDAEKIAWLVRFTMDPSSGGCKGTTSTEISRETESGVKDIWVTQDQLAGPLYLNNRAHADAMIKDLDSRPHKRSKTLRDMGVLEYHLFLDAEGKIIDRTKDTTSVAAEVDLSTDEYTQIRDAMRQGLGGSGLGDPTAASSNPKKSKEAREQLKLENEKKALADWQAKLADLSGDEKKAAIMEKQRLDAKKQFDKAYSDATTKVNGWRNIIETKVPQTIKTLDAKKYPKEMSAHIQKQAKQVGEQLTMFIATTLAAKPTGDLTAEDYERGAKEAQAKLQAITDVWKDWEKKVWNDWKSIGCNSE